MKHTRECVVSETGKIGWFKWCSGRFGSLEPEPVPYHVRFAAEILELSPARV